jgi:hypothetical protein
MSFILFKLIIQFKEIRKNFKINNFILEMPQLPSKIMMFDDSSLQKRAYKLEEYLCLLLKIKKQYFFNNIFLLKNKFIINIALKNHTFLIPYMIFSVI